MSTPPPLPSTTTEPFRDFAMLPLPGEEVDFYRVVECTPDRLRLRVPVMTTILGAVASAIVALIGFAVFWKTPVTGNPADAGWREGGLTVFLIASAVGVVFVAAIGRSLDVERSPGMVRLTRFFFRSSQYPAARIQEVVLSVAKPMDTPATVAAVPAGTPAAPKVPAFANRVNLSLAGTDELGKPMQLKVGSALLWSKQNWPVLAATAVHLSRLLHVPLKWDGALDRLDETARGQMARINELPH